jgi:hypothetical protein
MACDELINIGHRGPRLVGNAQQYKNYILKVKCESCYQRERESSPYPQSGLKVALLVPVPEAVVDMVFGAVLATFLPTLLFLNDHFGFRLVINL